MDGNDIKARVADVPILPIEQTLAISYRRRSSFQTSRSLVKVNSISDCHIFVVKTHCGAAALGCCRPYTEEERLSNFAILHE